jgi:hypothetical protein
LAPLLAGVMPTLEIGGNCKVLMCLYGPQRNYSWYSLFFQIFSTKFSVCYYHGLPCRFLMCLYLKEQALSLEVLCICVTSQI